MPISEIVTILTALTSITAVVLAFLPQWWARRKIQAEATTEGATAEKTKAEAANILVDTTMQLAARLDEQILSLISERDRLKIDYDRINGELAKVQEQLATVEIRFDECTKKLNLLLARSGISEVSTTPHTEVN